VSQEEDKPQGKNIGFFSSSFLRQTRPHKEKKKSHPE
jgi:hypothetical protein